MRSGGPSPAGWERWADGSNAGPRHNGGPNFARRALRSGPPPSLLLREHEVVVFDFAPTHVFVPSSPCSA
jgi:hypothetical protein